MCGWGAVDADEQRRPVSQSVSGSGGMKKSHPSIHRHTHTHTYRDNNTHTRRHGMYTYLSVCPTEKKEYITSIAGICIDTHPTPHTPPESQTLHKWTVRQIGRYGAYAPWGLSYEAQAAPHAERPSVYQPASPPLSHPSVTSKAQQRERARQRMGSYAVSEPCSQVGISFVASMHQPNHHEHLSIPPSLHPSIHLSR